MTPAASALVRVVRVANGAAVATVSVAGGYLAVVTAAASIAGRRPPRTCGTATGWRRFVVLVPAHDEEAGIAVTLRSIQAQHLDPERFSVHVVADNCTDGTAQVVRQLGVQVHERTAPEQPGKGPALNWLREQVDAAGVAYDCVVIVDADSSLDPHFLCAMDAALEEGIVAAQGFYGVRDPGASPATSVRYAALACRHHLRPLGRNALGASCGLYGNGMAFDASTTRGRPWSGHLVEDAEFQMELLLDGHLVRYVPEARLEAEMPGSAAAATSQNERWELGRVQLMRRYVPELLRAAIARRHGRRWPYLDAVVDHVVPPLSVLAAAEIAVVATSAADVALSRGRHGRRTLAASVVVLGVTAAHVLTSLRAVRAPRAVYQALSSAPRQVLWKVRLWARVLRRPDEVRWTRTQRNASSPPDHDHTSAAR